MYEFPEDGMDVQKHVRVGEDYAFKSVCNLFYKLINTEVFTFSKDHASIFDPLRSFEMLQNIHPITQCHIPGDLNPQHHCCETSNFTFYISKEGFMKVKKEKILFTTAHFVKSSLEFVSLPEGEHHSPNHRA